MVQMLFMTSVTPEGDDICLLAGSKKGILYYDYLRIQIIIRKIVFLFSNLTEI
jgi:hypothetical protein